MSSVTFADLFSQGSLCDLDVSTWAGLARVKPTDLGIPKTAAVAKALTFGHERLVAKSMLDPIRRHETDARKLLDENSIPFPLVQGSRYIPKARRTEIEAKLEELRGKFNAAVETFAAGYEAHRTEMRGTLRKAITDAAKDAAGIDGTMARLEGLYPSQEGVKNLFSMSWRFFSIAPPQDGTLADGETNAVEEAIEDMIKRLREEVAEKMTDMLALVARGGKLTQKTYNSAKAVCDRLESLNIFGDAGLAEAINKLRAVVNQAAAHGSDRTSAGNVLAEGLAPIKEALAKSADEAVKAAAERITGKGLRRMGL